MYKLRPLSELKKYEGNPRKILDEDLARLIQSVRDNPQYFEARPIILSDRTGDLVIIAGNQRYEAASFLELDVVPTFLIQGLTEQKEREIAIRDNVSNGVWDYDILHNEWNAIELAEWGLNIQFDDIAEEEEKPEKPANTTIKLEYTLEDYERVKNYLALIDSSPEQAVWKLCGFN